MLDGVYAADEFRRIRFYRLPPPDDAEVARVTARIARRIVRLLERRGLDPHGDPEEADPLQRDQVLACEALRVLRRMGGSLTTRTQDTGS